MNGLDQHNLQKTSDEVNMILEYELLLRVIYKDGIKGQQDNSVRTIQFFSSKEKGGKLQYKSGWLNRVRARCS